MGSLMVKYWSPKPADIGSNPIPSAIHWYSIMVNAGVLYTQDYRFKSYYQYYLGVPEWLMAQTANLMIRGFESHLQVYVLYR